MKKLMTRKLRLSRETLRTLDGDVLRAAAGHSDEYGNCGATDISCAVQRPCNTRTECGHCQI